MKFQAASIIKFALVVLCLVETSNLVSGLGLRSVRSESRIGARNSSPICGRTSTSCRNSGKSCDCPPSTSGPTDMTDPSSILNMTMSGLNNATSTADKAAIAIIQDLIGANGTIPKLLKYLFGTEGFLTVLEDEVYGATGIVNQVLSNLVGLNGTLTVLANGAIDAL